MDKDTFELVEDYLVGRLSPEEEVAFRNRLSVEPGLAEEIVAQKETHKAVELYARIRTKEKVKSLHQGIKTSPKIIIRSVVLMAASILLLMAFSFIWYANTNFTNQVLSENNYTYPSFTMRGEGNTESDTLFKQIAKAYTAKDYEHAISLLSSIPPGENYNTAQFYLGNLYLETGRAEDAVGVFRNVELKDDKRYLENIQWALAVAHLQNDDPDQASKSLDQILKNPDHSLYEQASIMKKNLTSFWRKLVF